MASPVIYFELPADDVPRAKAFYEKTFGWAITRLPGMDYYAITTRPQGEPGIDGGLMPRRMPEQTALCDIHVESVNAALKKIRENGGMVLVGKTPIPGFGWFAVFQDPEGNPPGLHEMERPG